MLTESTTGVIARQEWLKPIEETVQRGIQNAFRSGGPAGQRVRNALHGTWLGHPLHAALTDVPIGAWTAAMVFDAIDAVTDRKDFGVAADGALAVGIAGALCAAVAGLTDWQDTDPPARRIGLTHGLLNIGAVALFTGSFVARKRKSRASGHILSALGYAVASVAARLGGNLVYEHRVGVDHTSGQSFPDHFVALMAESELPEGELRRVEQEGTPILLAKRDRRIYALAETCSHMGGPLSEGECLDGSVKCPWHGSRFALADGRVLDGPAVHPQPCLRVRVRNGQIEVAKATGRHAAEERASLAELEESPAPTAPTR